MLNVQPFPARYKNVAGELHPNRRTVAYWDKNHKYLYSTTPYGTRSVPGDHRLDDASIIYMSGDSFTFGVGVPDNGALPSALLRELESKHGRRFAVVNAGVVGTGIGDHIEAYRQFSKFHKPKVVVEQFYYFAMHHANKISVAPDRKKEYSVIWDSLYSDEILKFILAGLERFPILASANHFFVSDASSSEKLQESVNILELTTEMKQVLYHPGRLLDEKNVQVISPLWNEYLRSVKTFRDLASKDGSDFLLLIIPDKSQMDEYLNAPAAMIAEYCDKNGIRYLDLTDSFRANTLDNGLDLYQKHDFHLNELGNAFAAKIVLDELNISYPGKDISVKKGNGTARVPAFHSVNLIFDDSGTVRIDDERFVRLEKAELHNTELRREAGGGVKYCATNEKNGQDATIRLELHVAKPVKRSAVVFNPHLDAGDNSNNRVDAVLGLGNQWASFSTSHSNAPLRYKGFDSRAFVEVTSEDASSDALTLEFFLRGKAGLSMSDKSNEELRSPRRIEVFLYDR